MVQAGSDYNKWTSTGDAVNTPVDHTCRSESDLSFQQVDGALQAQFFVPEQSSETAVLKPSYKSWRFLRSRKPSKVLISSFSVLRNGRRVTLIECLC